MKQIAPCEKKVGGLLLWKQGLTVWQYRKRASAGGSVKFVRTNEHSALPKNISINITVSEILQ